MTPFSVILSVDSLTIVSIHTLLLTQHLSAKSLSISRVLFEPTYDCTVESSLYSLLPELGYSVSFNQAYGECTKSIWVISEKRSLRLFLVGF